MNERNRSRVVDAFDLGLDGGDEVWGAIGLYLLGIDVEVDSSSPVVDLEATQPSWPTEEMTFSVVDSGA